MYGALAFFLLVTIPAAFGKDCGTAATQPALEKLKGNFEIVKRVGVGFLGEECANIKIEGDATELTATITSKKLPKDKDPETVADVVLKIKKNGEKFEIKRDGKDVEADYRFTFHEADDKGNLLIGCKNGAKSEDPISFMAALMGDPSDDKKKAMTEELKKYEKSLDSLDKAVEHNSEKCSGAAYLVPSVLIGIIMVLVTKLS